MNEIGKDTNFFIINLGILYLAFILLVINIPLYFLTRRFAERSQLCMKAKNKLEHDLFWNSFIRWLIQSCLDICLGFAAQLYYYSRTSGEKEDFYEDEMSTPFGYINLVSMIILTIICVLFPIYVLIWYLPRFYKWKTDKFEKKFGSVFSGLRRDRKSSLFFIFIFFV